MFFCLVYGACHSTSRVSGEGSMAYSVVVVIGSLLTIRRYFFVLYMAHAIPRATPVARGHGLFYNSVRIPQRMTLHLIFIKYPHMSSPYYSCIGRSFSLGQFANASFSIIVSSSQTITDSKLSHPSNAWAPILFVS